jgi:hypothetical protein
MTSNSYASRFFRVFILPVISFYSNLMPPIRFNSLDNIPNLHVRRSGSATPPPITFYHKGCRPFLHSEELMYRLN